MSSARPSWLAVSALLCATLGGCDDPAPVAPTAPSRLSLLFTGHVIGEIEPCG